MIQAIRDTIASAFGTLGANKLRSALTLLGIVIQAPLGLSRARRGARREGHRSRPPRRRHASDPSHWCCRGCKALLGRLPEWCPSCGARAT